MSAASTVLSTTDNPLANAPTSAVARGLFVYSVLSIPPFVDAAPHILKLASSIPVVKDVSNGLVRATFFDHFVGGESIEDTLTSIEELRRSGKGTLLGYSVEVQEDEAASAGSSADSDNKHRVESNVNEVLKSIRVAGQIEDARGVKDPLGRKTWVALKFTALLPDANSLKHLSELLIRLQPDCGGVYEIHDILESPETFKAAGGSAEHFEGLRQLYDDLNRFGQAAVESRVRIVIDAEHTWYQPAIDAFTFELMKKFGSLKSDVQPLVYLTFQAYLRSTPNRLRASFDHARKHKYAFGVKLVRGAYHPHELAYHASSPSASTSLPPVWQTKDETDTCYNQCTAYLLDKVKEGLEQGHDTAILFAGHNRESCERILAGIVQRGLGKEEQGKVVVEPDVAARIVFGQLLGMADDLTNYLVQKIDSPTSPMVLKYVPYGPFEDVMPYLSRRAIENKSVLGGGSTPKELKRYASELLRRLTPPLPPPT